MIGISSGGVFRLSGNCFRSSPKFLWKVNRSWNFGEESVSSKSGVLNGIASDQASRYFRYRLPSEGISEGGVYQVGNLKRTDLRLSR